MDDALVWFYRNAMNLDDKNKELLERGKSDNIKIANVSVTIRYTTEFAETLGVFFKDGLLMVAASFM